MQLARDKALSKTIARTSREVRAICAAGRRSRAYDGFAFPLIVKPQFGDGSDEIGAFGVANERQLRDG